MAAGADYIDVNPDEIHHDLQIQKRAMRWAVQTVQDVSPIPPSVDSSRAELIAEGLTNREIAERVHLAEKTVKNYVSYALQKLGVSRRAEAAAYFATHTTGHEHEA